MQCTHGQKSGSILYARSSASLYRVPDPLHTDRRKHKRPDIPQKVRLNYHSRYKSWDSGLFSARLKIPGKLRLSSSWQFYRRIILSVFRILPGFWESPVHRPPSEEKNPKGFGKETKKQKMKDRKELPEN